MMKNKKNKKELELKSKNKKDLFLNVQFEKDKSCF